MIIWNFVKFSEILSVPLFCCWVYVSGQKAHGIAFDANFMIWANVSVVNWSNNFLQYVQCVHSKDFLGIKLYEYNMDEDIINKRVEFEVEDVIYVLNNDDSEKRMHVQRTSEGE